MKKKLDLNKIPKADVSKKLDELVESARVLRFKTEGARSKNVKELSTLKKEIARVLTFINQSKQNAK